MYFIQRLEGPAGSSSPVVFALNAHGAVAGAIRDANHTLVGVIWTDGLPSTVLPANGGSILYDINSHGVAVGLRGWSNTPTCTAIRAGTGGMADLLPDLAGNGSVAIGINDAGVICGGIVSVWRGFIYDSSTNQFRKIDPLPGETTSWVGCLNNRREFAVKGNLEAFLYTAEPNLAAPGHTKNIGPVTIDEINDSGIVVGDRISDLVGTVPGQCRSRASDPVWTDIPLPAGFFNGYASGVNRQGDVVGTCWSTQRGHGYSAFVSRRDVSVDLNLLVNEGGWHLEHAMAINNSGQICGTGTYFGEPAAWLLSPPIYLPLPELDRIWPIPLPKGPPGPVEDARWDAHLLTTIDQMARAIIDGPLRDRVRSALIDAARMRLAFAAHGHRQPAADAKPTPHDADHGRDMLHRKPVAPFVSHDRK